jgi:serine/threonine protein kinase
MTYLHNEGVLHRDLKSANVLVADDKILKICDFGLSRATAGRSAEHLSKADTGTYIYVAPEGEASQVPYSTACDIYSYAVLINEMASMKVPWVEIVGGDRPDAAKEYIVLNKVKEGERLSLAVAAAPELQQLIQDCWAQHPGDRPGFDTIQERLRESNSGCEGYALRRQYYA